MAGESRGDAPLQGRVFERRLLLKIESWDANLHLGSIPRRSKRGRHVDGELVYSRGFDLQCRVVAPAAHRGQPIHTNMMLLEPRFLFSASRPMGFGQFYTRSENPELSPLSLSLYMHEQDLAFIATCLGSTWKFLHVWISEEYNGRADVTDYSFASEIHPNLDAWIAAK